MKDSPKKNIVILGNGISGITAARHLRKRTDRPITIISEEHPLFFFKDGTNVCLYGTYAVRSNAALRK